MKTIRHSRLAALLLSSAAACAILSAPALAAEQPANIQHFDIPPQDAAMALNEYARQAGVQIVFPYDYVRGRQTPSVQGDLTRQDALAMLTTGLGLKVTSDNSGMITLRDAADPQSGSAAGDGADGTVAALIVTAQKKEENVQDVPIAISAFTEKTLQEQKIEGGFDLLKAIPNVTFSKNNFTSYNFSIRGIGTKAVSATTDPGVAVAFNNSALIVNRLFEQEYFDIERVEVLRGPQGTLYGRNATAGVINVISAKPNLNEFSGWLKGEVGNYNTKRVSAMTNIPLIDGVLGVRLAGALTNREGYGYNAVTKSDVDGRDLWSARLTIGFEPVESLRANLVWERFNEDDNRARTSKQLCHTDPGPASLGSVTNIQPLARAMMSQGCLPGSLYNADAFHAPNGDSLPYVFVLKGNNGSPVVDDFSDPYGGLTQSTDLRVISSKFDPIYKAKADVIELNMEYDLTPSLTLVSQTAYDKDKIYSTQDFNRFNTQPVISTAANACHFQYDNFLVNHCPGGYFTDPQLGPSNTIVTQDISEGTSEQFSQEFRIQSNFDGPFNFSLGANYVRFRTNIDYYVFSNALTIASRTMVNGTTNPTDPNGGSYIDPNPLDQITGAGQNYFHSKNPYKLKSTSAFGETYFQFAPDLKLTVGLRYTDDRKKFELWPTVLLNSNKTAYQHTGDLDQHWGEFTGRIGLDWKPDLSFTDQTMIYAFYSRGYKAGGANPPNMAPSQIPAGTILPVPPNAVHSPTFDPEFVNAFEIGAKNVLFGGALVFNTDAFYYDYKDYQVSQIVDRLALNENFDAKNWGLEFETVWSPTRNLRINANLGYLDTRIGDGESSIDPMNRTYGHSDDWVVLKNWIQYPSNCIVPKDFAARVIQFERDNPDAVGVSNPIFLERTFFFGLFSSPCEDLFSPTGTNWLYGAAFYQGTGIGYNPYDKTLYPDTNNGAGFSTPLGGNELPNAPHWTTNIGAQYSHEILDGTWKATVRADAYWQSQSWARVYNLDPYDKLHGWYNANLSFWVENEKGLKIEVYVKNLLDEDPITDAFLNSDDTGLTTNVFVLDPRLIGLSIHKDF